MVSRKPDQRRALIPGWLWAVIGLLGVGVVIAAVSGSTSDSKAAFVPAEVAVAKVASLPVYAAPNGQLTHSLPNPDPTNYNQPQISLVLVDQGGWLKLSLPLPPNGQTGWVRRTQVTVEQNDYRVDVARSAHQRPLQMALGERILRTRPRS